VQALREAAILLHDLVVILFSMAIVFHIYLGTVAEPGTFASMTRGTVSKAWARCTIRAGIERSRRGHGQGHRR